MVAPAPRKSNTPANPCCNRSRRVPFPPPSRSVRSWVPRAAARIVLGRRQADDLPCRGPGKHLDNSSKKPEIQGENDGLVRAGGSFAPYLRGTCFFRRRRGGGRASGVDKYSTKFVRADMAGHDPGHALKARKRGRTDGPATHNRLISLDLRRMTPVTGEGGGGQRRPGAPKPVRGAEMEKMRNQSKIERRKSKMPPSALRRADRTGGHVGIVSQARRAVQEDSKDGSVQTLPRTMEMLWPPKPKLLQRAYRTSWCWASPRQ